ncbi:MAG: META domain-containing protein [Burkholderiales bacterium]|nr:MAG: META domain-containing protein [Burkholderiales bacterium]
MTPRRPDCRRFEPLMLALALAAALVAGCASPRTGDDLAVPPQPDTQAQGEHMAITGTRWVWAAATTAAGRGGPPPDQLFWIHFEDAQRASVQADCNRGFAEIRVASGGLSFPRVAVTRRACGTRSLDDRFVRLLEAVTGAYIEDGRLKMTLAPAMAGPAGIIEFRRMTPTPYVCDDEQRFVAWAIAGSPDLVFEIEGRSSRLNRTTSGAGLRYESAIASGETPIEFRAEGRAATASGPGFALGRCRMAPTAQAW